MSRLAPERICLIAAAGLLASCTLVSAQARYTPPADRNAALAYSTLFYTDFPKEMTEAVDGADLNEVGLETDPGKQPEAFKAAAEQVRARQGAVKRLLQATRLAKCDFEIAYESGFNALLPHLGSMRKAARMLRVDARRLLLEGDAEGAAERIAGIYGLSRHLKSDGTLISSLVAIAIAGLANAESDVLVQSGKLTAAGRENLVQAIESLGRSDPFGVKDAIVGERRITVTWVRERFPAPGSGAAFVKSVTQEWGLVPTAKEELREIAKMNDEEFTRALDRLDEYHILMQTQWDLPDAPARLDVLSRQIGEGNFGPLTKFLAPSLAKARQGQAKAEAELESATKRLRDYVAPRTVGPAGGK